MSRLAFFRDNAPWLAAGGLLTFGSSFGQTFFISIFAGEIRTAFDLTHSAWGGIYAIGTFASAAAMLMLGGLADRFRTRALAIIVLLAFALTCLGMAAIPGVWALPFVIFGLRFCGQGMMSHLAVVSVGRWFRAARGRAISMVAMGYSIGEAILPVTFVLLMGWIGWRMSWAVAAALILGFIPLFMLFLRRERSPRGQLDADGSPGMGGLTWTRGMALRHWLFWVSLPGFLAQPVFGTAFFFQQVHLTEIKGWPLERFVALMPVYTAASVAALFAGGWAVDRYGSGRVLPVYLLPMAAGFAVVAASPDLWGAALGLALIGAMQGASAAVVGAFWPEHYGSRHLGAIRSVAAAVMVFATALGPAITGVMIDAGIDYRAQLLGMAAYSVIVSAILGLAMRRVRQGLSA